MTLLHRWRPAATGALAGLVLMAGFTLSLGLWADPAARVLALKMGLGVACVSAAVSALVQSSHWLGRTLTGTVTSVLVMGVMLAWAA